MAAMDTIPPPQRAIDLCKYMPLSGDGKAALTPEMTPDEFLSVLLERKLIADSLQLIAHLLPKRQSVFWAMTCARQPGQSTDPAAEAALKAAEKWIADPSEPNRQACLEGSNEADSATPAGATALAAYYSTGLPPGNDPRSNAKAYFMTARLVAGAVAMAATSGDTEQTLPRFDAYIAKGVEIYKRTSGR